MFTFAILTYNHEKYIIEHLESIKYQINMYGGGRKFSLIVSDDSSKDDTIKLIKLWLRINSNLFEEVNVVTSDINKGIVKNYLRAIDCIRTPAYKLLAGDDLYYRNNIFEVVNMLDEFELIFTPTISFVGDSITNYKDLNFALLCNSNKQVRRLLKFSNIFNAPGAFFKINITKDEELKKFISQYKWIEDLPTWHYLFFIKRNIKYIVSKVPYVLYRNSQGISTNVANDKNSVFEIEKKQIYSDYNMVLNKYPSIINPYRYVWKILILKMKVYDTKFNSNIIEYNKIIDVEIGIASSYLKEIREYSSEFYKLI